MHTPIAAASVPSFALCPGNPPRDITRPVGECIKLDAAEAYNISIQATGDRLLPPCGDGAFAYESSDSGPYLPGTAVAVPTAAGCHGYALAEVAASEEQAHHQSQRSGRCASNAGRHRPGRSSRAHPPIARALCIWPAIGQPTQIAVLGTYPCPLTIRQRHP